MTNEQSKVLTLVFTDLADSTALKRERGDVPVGDLIAQHREKVTQLADECAGRVIDWAGDGCFLTFDTSSAGVMFALRLQQAHAEDATMPGVRIGLHMGEVTEKEGPHGPGGPPRIEGLAVDLAARIQGLAKPGQVLMSSSVYQSARQRLGVDTFGAPILWQAYGDYTIKGFDDPLDICEAGLEGLSPLVAPEASDKAQPLVPVTATPQVEIMPPDVPSPVRRYVIIVLFFAAVIAVTLGTDYFARLIGNGEDPGAAEDAKPITSLAVLPLDNLSGDPEQAYFADGMTEAVTSELAKIRSLKVISRASAQRYRDTTLSMEEIAAELGVEGLVVGSVAREGDDVRIAVQLIDGRTDAHVWSGSYEDTVTSALKLQSRVALAIADTLRAELSPDERERIADAREVNREAYEVYLQAMHGLTDFTPNGLYAVRELFTKAAQLDPDFGEAWSGIAMTNLTLGTLAVGSPHPHYESAREAAVRALDVDPELGEAQAILGITDLYLELDWASARNRLALGERLTPNSAFVVQILGSFSVFEGNFSDAEKWANRQLELNPQGLVFVVGAALSMTYIGHIEQAIKILEGEVAKDSTSVQASIFLAVGYIFEGDFDAALAEFKRMESMTGSIPTVQSFVAFTQALGGDADEARAILDRLTSTTPPDVLAVSGVPWAYFALGDADEGFTWLELGAESPSGIYLGSVRNMPFVDAWMQSEGVARIADDPRYWQLIERLGYPPLPPDHPGYAQEQAWKERKAELEAASAPIEKLAVLPFDNMSSDDEQEYFVDGMTEALIAELAKIKSIKVISRTSVMQYKDSDKSLPEIASELGVDALVEGSVMKAENEVRVTAQLVNGRTDEHLWAESYTNSLENVFKLQAEVALAITDEINAVVTPQERSRIASAETVDPEAYRLYLQGRQMWSRRTRESLVQALDLFERAIEIDPEFALAHVAIADVYVLYTDYTIDSAARSVPQAVAAANRALAIAPNLGEAFAVLGYVKEIGNFDWAGAEADLRNAIELNPGYSVAYMWLAHTLLVQGRNAESVELARHAYELDPLSQTVTAIYGYTLVAAGRVDDGLQLFDDTEPVHENGVNYQIYRALAAARMGDFESAVKRFDKARELFGPSHLHTAMRIAALAMTGNVDQAREELSVLMESEPNDAAATGLVWAFAALGETDAAFEWFDRAIQRGGQLVAATNSLGRPFVEPIALDPRYQDRLRRMNLQPTERAN